MSMRSGGLFSAMIEMTRHVLITFLISGNDVISLESRPQKQIVEYDVKGKYHEKYSTVDKIGSKKPLAGKSCFV